MFIETFLYGETTMASFSRGEERTKTLTNFIAADNGRRFRLVGSRYRGRLEFPIHDPGHSEPEEGILWLDIPELGWVYVKPCEVTLAEGE